MQLSAATFDPAQPIAIVHREGISRLRRPDEPLYVGESWDTVTDPKTGDKVDRTWSSVDDAIAGALEQRTSFSPVKAVVKHGDAYKLLVVYQNRWDGGVLGSKQPAKDGIWVQNMAPSSAPGAPLRVSMNHIISGSASDREQRFDGPLELTGNRVEALVGSGWILTDGAFRTYDPAAK